jgi:integrase
MLNEFDMDKSYLNDDYVAQLICPTDKSHYEVFDANLKGFYIDVQPSGHKCFRLRHRVKSKLRVTTLGNALLISADQARKMAVTVLAGQSFGHDINGLELMGSDLSSNAVLMGETLESFFLEKYIPYVKSYKRSWKTDFSMIRNHLVPQIGRKSMRFLSPPDVAIFVDHIKQKGYAIGTINRALVLLRYGIELAIRWKKPGIEFNPVKEIKNIKDDNKLERYLSNEQGQVLMQAVAQSSNAMLQHIVLFLIYTGARKNEVLQACWQDIDWHKSSWHIPKTKSGKVRHVPLSLGAVDLLNRLRIQVKPDHNGKQAIFSNPETGKPFISFFYSWNSARLRAGMPEFRIHDLRHSFASYLVNAGRSLYEVQELLGHADIKTTSRYAHLSRERLAQAVEHVPQINYRAAGA